MPPGEEAHPTRLIFVSASVYEAGLTKLAVWCDGREAVCWTRINTRYFECFDQFVTEGRPYYMMATVLAAEHPGNAGKDGCPVAALRSKTYVVTASDARDKTAVHIIRDIHKLYRAEESRLRGAYGELLGNTALRVAAPLAPPPPPKPVTIHFWKRDVVQDRRDSQTEGGGRK